MEFGMLLSMQFGIRILPNAVPNGIRILPNTLPNAIPFGKRLLNAMQFGMAFRIKQLVKLYQIQKTYLVNIYEIQLRIW